MVVASEVTLGHCVTFGLFGHMVLKPINYFQDELQVENISALRSVVNMFSFLFYLFKIN